MTRDSTGVPLGHGAFVEELERHLKWSRNDKLRFLNEHGRPLSIGYDSENDINDAITELLQDLDDDSEWGRDYPD